MAAGVQLEGAQPVNQNHIENVGEIQHRKITELREHHLRKHVEAERPLQSFLTGVCLIVSIAATIFASATLTCFPATMIGLATMMILMGLSKWIVKKLVDQSHQRAADALMAPGFYEFAMGQPNHLATAQAINNTFLTFLHEGELRNP